MKRIVSLIMAVLMLCALCVPAFAKNASATKGQCGDKLYWEISEDHAVLTFTGEGAMWDYEYWRIYGDIVPWWDYRDTVTTINFPKDISHISQYAFCYFSQIRKVWIPSDTLSLGKQCFFGCENLEIVALGTVDGKTSGNITIGSESFEECGLLVSVYVSRGLKTVGWDAFEQCYNLPTRKEDARVTGRIFYGGTEQEFQDNVTVDMGSDNGNQYFTNSRFYYRDDIWDKSKWSYNDQECWHEIRHIADFATILHSNFDLTKADVTPFGNSYEHDGTTYWQLLPDGTRVNEKPIVWEHDDTGYSATLPDGTVLSGTFEWQSDGREHWYALPNRERFNIGAHTRENGVCTVCGSSDTASVSYLDTDGRFVVSSAQPDQLTSGTRTLSGGEYIAKGKVTIGGRLEVSADSTIILMDGCEVNCTGGIHVPENTTLTISSESLDPNAMGSLNATASLYGSAGIGGNCISAWRGNPVDGFVHIVICGGRVTGKGADNSAGIGTGQSWSSGTTVDIYNGIVTGIGGKNGAGIGSGEASSCNVNIYGGTVEAQGGDCGTGIGSGMDGSATVYISRSATVNAHGGQYATNTNGEQDHPTPYAPGTSDDAPALSSADAPILSSEAAPIENRPFEDGDYIIYSALNSEQNVRMCVDIDGSNGATNATDNVHLWSADGENKAAYNVFTLTWDESAGAYSIMAKHSGLMLDVAGGSKENGANIQQWGDNGTDAQRWVFQPASDGYYYIRCLGGQYMDASGCVNGVLPADDTNIQSWEYTGAANQMFMPVRELDNAASALSEGNRWIAAAVGAAAVIAVAAIVIVKKKKPSDEIHNS